jgi:hypothetical protein
MASGGLEGLDRPSGTLILLHEVVVWALGRHLPLRRFRNDRFGQGLGFDARPRFDCRGIFGFRDFRLAVLGLRLAGSQLPVLRLLLVPLGHLGLRPDDLGLGLALAVAVADIVS